MKNILLSLAVASGLLAAQDTVPQPLKLTLTMYDYVSNKGFPDVSVLKDKSSLALVEILKQNGDTALISSTEVMTRSGETSSLSRIAQIPYDECSSVNNEPMKCKTVYVEAGYKMRITPTVSENKHIMTDVEMEFTDMIGFKSFSVAGKEIKIPIVPRDHQKAQYDLKDGDVVVLTNQDSPSHYRVALVSAKTLH